MVSKGGQAPSVMPGRLIPRPLYVGHDLVTILDASIGCPDCPQQMTLISAMFYPPMTEWRCDHCGSEVREYD